MPIFEFYCPSCGHQFEELVLRQAEASHLSCPKCKRPGAEKLLSVFSSGKGSSERALSASGAGCGSASSRFS
jgi:putative FmdB family regulatory protein